MKKLILVLFAIGLVFSWTTQGWAPTSTATAALTATIPSKLSVSLTTDTKTSIATDAIVVKFDKIDSDDKGVVKPNAGYMYAPYRSHKDKNWHVASMTANGLGTVTLKVDASLTGINKTRLGIWFGGFYKPGSDTPLDDTFTVDQGEGIDSWEALGSSKSTSGPFVGICPFNYRLNISDLAGGKTYAGTITYTLTQ